MQLATEILVISPFPEPVRFACLAGGLISLGLHGKLYKPTQSEVFNFKFSDWYSDI